MRDEITTGEALSDDGQDAGVDVTGLTGRGSLGMVPLAVFMQQCRERRAFNAYRVAFRANEAHPNLKNAAALVKAWNQFAEVMGISRV